MRSFVVAVALSLVLGAAPVFGQTGQPAGAGASQTTPAQPASAQPPRPFPENPKVAIVNFQRIEAESAEGKAFNAKAQSFIQQKQTQISEMEKKLAADQLKQQQQQSVLNEQARSQLESDIQRQTKEIQRFRQDAQEEVQDLLRDLQASFQRKLLPIIQQVAQERGIHLMLSYADSGLIWHDPGIDVTADVIKRLDAATPASSAPATATPPPSSAAPAPASPGATTTPAKPQPK
jgi:outer membrane protein